MRRFFAFFLLMLLPLQFAFAAAAPYCALEKVEVEAHFGHHEHPDAPAPAPLDDGDDKGLTDDCGVCHLGSAQVQLAIASIAALPLRAAIVALPDDRDPQHFLEPSERPPRTPLA